MEGEVCHCKLLYGTFDSSGMVVFVIDMNDKTIARIEWTAIKSFGNSVINIQLAYILVKCLELFEFTYIHTLRGNNRLS